VQFPAASFFKIGKTFFELCDGHGTGIFRIRYHCTINGNKSDVTMHQITGEGIWDGNRLRSVCTLSQFREGNSLIFLRIVNHQ
jgi:hypothetical protein